MTWLTSERELPWLIEVALLQRKVQSEGEADFLDLSHTCIMVFLLLNLLPNNLPCKCHQGQLPGTSWLSEFPALGNRVAGGGNFFFFFFNLVHEGISASSARWRNSKMCLEPQKNDIAVARIRASVYWFVSLFFLCGRMSKPASAEQDVCVSMGSRMRQSLWLWVSRFSSESGCSRCCSMGWGRLELWWHSSGVACSVFFLSSPSPFPLSAAREGSERCHNR